MSHQTGMSRLFLKDSYGRLVSRRPDVWSIKYDQCRGCGTTEKKHDAQGYCHNCYVKYRYATDPNYKARADARQKRRRLLTDWQEQYDKKRQWNKNHREQRRVICSRWAKKHAKFAAGTQVEYSLIPSFWIRGVVVENARGKCLVRFDTYKDWLPHRSLRKVSNV